MSSRSAMQTVAGLATARGFAAGPVFLYRGDGEIPVPEYLLAPDQVEEEMQRLKRARAATRRDLENLIAVLRERAGHQDVKIFEGHLMILDDPTLEEETDRAIVEERLNAEAAVRRTAHGARDLFAHMNDAYFRERVCDLDDVERRLLKQLTGFSGTAAAELRSPCVIVADDLTPSETVQLPREFVLGFATNGGSTTSHVALLARAMGIPCVTGLGNITSLVKAGELILLDGTSGSVTLSPDAATLKAFRALVARQAELMAGGEGLAAGTLADGSEVSVFANIHPGVPVEGLRERGARGVGLYRSEYLWLNRESEPSEEDQYEAYANAVRSTRQLAPDASITIRLLDIGGDKTVKGISAREPNPFLGNRSIRFLLQNQSVLRIQLRAILRASAHGCVRLMYPMVSCIDELREVTAILAEEKARLDAAGLAYDRGIKVGAMIEVPSAALNADALARHVDFFSIGTNDLVQYTMAADRGNDAVSHLYQPTNPAVLKLVQMTVDAARRNGIGVSVCGESASDPVIGLLWVALGVDMLSMSAGYIPLVSRVLSRFTRADLNAYAAMIGGLGCDHTGNEIYEACRRWIVERAPDLEELLA